MRHHLTFLAFGVKLLCIGLVYLISISLCAAQEKGEESVAELIDKLFSDEREIWQEAVRPLTQLQEKIVQPLAEEAKKRGKYSYGVQMVYGYLTTAAAKKELIALLDDKDERICEIAAEALMKHGESTAAPALTKAMERVQDDRIQWNIAGALWQVEPNDQSAEAILSVARKQKGQYKEALFGIVDNPTGHRQMTEAERLNFLLNYKLPTIVGYPEALDISLNPREEFEQKLLSDNDDRLFVEKHRSQVIDIMLVYLRDSGSIRAALLLGYFKEPKALPSLQKWFIESDSFYGWEGGWNELGYYQFPDRHCYEEAIKHITGKPINEVIKLTDEQVMQLVQGYRQAKSYGYQSKLYVLFRLKPHIAREEATRKFRNLKTKGERFRFCHLMPDLLPKGLLLTEVGRLLGEPDRVRESSWFYDCGNSPGDDLHVLTITFENDRVIKIDVALHKDK